MIRSICLALFLVTFVALAEEQPVAPGYETLPDDYLLFVLAPSDSALVGSCEFLEDFTVSIRLPQEFITTGYDSTALLNFFRDREVGGTLLYPSGRTTSIAFDVVTHRQKDEIYMKSTLGYFLWERLFVQNGEVTFAIYWWYKPPASTADLDVIQDTKELLTDSATWHQADDRDCDNDITDRCWSLFCALKHASLARTGEYNHHNCAIQTVREVIREFCPEVEYDHVLMEFNNCKTTTHADLMTVVNETAARIEAEISNRQ